MTADFNFHKHQVGDGVHYITDHHQVHEDGTEQFGDTSEVCILRTVQAILFENNTGLTMGDLWNAVYPDDPMSEDDLAVILTNAQPFTEPFDATNQENISAVVYDLREMGCGTLADRMLQAIWPTPSLPVVA